MLLGEGVVLYPSEHAAQVLIKVLHDDEDVVEAAIAVLSLLGRYDDVEELWRE
jgi:hypothetical protein